MNTASNQEENQEQAKEVDLKEKLHEFIGLLPYDERKIIKECKWRDTDKKWDEGFLEFIEKDVQRKGKSGPELFKDFVKDLRREYENTSSSEDPENKKLYKAQYNIAQKMLGLYTSEKEPEAVKKKNALEKGKSIYGMENIRFTIAHIRKQILGLLGVNDPWWTEEHEQKRQALLGITPEKKVSKPEAANDNGATPTKSETTATPAAETHPSEEKKAA